MPENQPAPAYEHNGRPVSAEDFYVIACDPRRSVAVEACAGAGKTWMLVSRIVRALLEGMDAAEPFARVAPHEILAITFTKRAANEMRERLYQWLHEFAGASEQKLASELRMRGVRAAHDGKTLQVLGQRLAKLYGRVLETGRLVQIRTFHSWFAALLKAAPLAVLHRLGLPVNYELLEDDVAATALVWRRFYQALVDDPDRRQDFLALVRVHGRSQTEKALSMALDKRIEFALSDAAGLAEASVQSFADFFPELAGYAAPADAVCDPLARARWLARAALLGREANKTPQKAAQAILDALARADQIAMPDAATEALAVLRKGFFIADEDRLNQNLVKFAPAQEAAQELVRLCAATRQHEAWLHQQRMVRLSRVLIGQYAALKRERGWVDMTDVERAALTLLSDPVLSGWVQERLDVRVRHLLIDEFQDTNPLQWQALSSWLGSYAGARGTAPSVFIVGDPKQSIYRFRRAEPQVFRAAQVFVTTVLGGDRLSCDHTRRNARSVIATVNATMTAPGTVEDFDGFRAHTTDSVASGLVASLPPIARGSTRDDGTSEGGPPVAGTTWRDSLTMPREVAEETLRTREARQVARWIASRVHAGAAPRDVMVLSRRRAGLLPVQVELRALGVAAQIGEKTALIDCCEVQDMVALLDVLVSHQHDLSLARVLKCPLFGLDDTALLRLALQDPTRKTAWFDLLQRSWPRTDPLGAVGPVLLRWRGWVRALPPHDALQAIYSDGDVLARYAVAVPVTQRPAVLANLRVLLETTLLIGGGRYTTPYAFVRALKAGGVQAPAALVDNAVRLLTIHGAKGLEAEAVVLLDTDTPQRAAETMGVLVDWPGHAARPERMVFVASERRPPACAVDLLEVEYSQRRREELNALYVALTRARDTLIVSSIEPHREAPGSWWQRLGGVADRRLNLPGPVPVARVADVGVDGCIVMELPLLDATKPGPPIAGAVAQGDADEDTPRARLGKAMHRLLEWGGFAPAQVDAVAREFALTVEQSHEAAAMARRILEGEGAWSWDDQLVDWQATEVDLVHQGLFLRLDRLVHRREPGQWWVLDFKSARNPQLQPDLVAQLRAYRSAVQVIYPQAVVRAAFLAADGSMIVLADDPQ